MNLDRHTLNLSKFPGLEWLTPKDYNRGYKNGFRSGLSGRTPPPGLPTLKLRLTTSYGTGYRHGFVQGARNRRDGK